MSKVWLPTQYTLEHKPSGQVMPLIIPGAEHMDVSQLREIIQWQQERFAKEVMKPKPQRQHSKKEVGLALKEYLEYLHRRNESW